jgi:hypothetical protein
VSAELVVNNGWRDVLYLHDLAEAALADDLEELEIVNGQAVLSVLDKVDANLHGTAAKLDIDPVGTGLACSGGLALAGLVILSLFLESWVDSQCSDEDVFVAASVRGCRGVANVQGYGEIGHSRNIELVLCVAASPKRVLWRTRDGVDENLLLVEINQGVREVLRRVAAVDGGRSVDAASSRLGTAGAIRAGSWGSR